MKIVLALAATLAAATPALAEPREPKAVSEGSAQEGVPAPKVREQRVCLVDTVTGSRIERKACHTRSEWRAMNVDLPAGV